MFLDHYYSWKELSLCDILLFSSPNIFATQWRIPLIIKTSNSVRSTNLSLKFYIFTSQFKIYIYIKIWVCVKNSFPFTLFNFVLALYHILNVHLFHDIGILDVVSWYHITCNKLVSKNLHFMRFIQVHPGPLQSRHKSPCT